MDFEPDSVQLPDGRRLAFATLGPAGGFPVIYLHGGIGTALRATPELTDAVERHGVRWVALSRPGFGGSDDHPARTLRSVAEDVRALAESRGWARIAVVGVSTGGPYALACAAAAPELVVAVALAASLSGQCAPHEAPGIPRTTRWFLRAIAAAPRASSRVLGGAAQLLRRYEAAVVRLAGPRRAEVIRSLGAAVERGVRGPVDDFCVAARPWGFDAAQIATEVHIWHGLRDKLVPAELLWQLAGALPKCRVWMDPDESHFFFRRRSTEIAGELVAVARKTALVSSARSGACATGPWAVRASGEGCRADRVQSQV